MDKKLLLFLIVFPQWIFAQTSLEDLAAPPLSPSTEDVVESLQLKRYPGGADEGKLVVQATIPQPLQKVNLQELRNEVLDALLLEQKRIEESGLPEDGESEVGEDKVVEEPADAVDP